MANPNGVRDSSAADAAQNPYVGYPGTGLERPAYNRVPQRGGQRGVFVLNKYHQSRKRMSHGPDLTTARISNTRRGLGRPKMSKLQVAVIDDPTGDAMKLRGTPNQRFKDAFKIS